MPQDLIQEMQIKQLKSLPLAEAPKNANSRQPIGNSDPSLLEKQLPVSKRQKKQTTWI
jgi:hypothetical protein